MGNPYQSPQASSPADAANGTFVAAIFRFAMQTSANKWALRTIMLLSALGCLHFIFSFSLWVFYCYEYWPESPSELWYGTWHIIVLFMISAIAFFAAFFGKRVSVILLGIFFIASASAFANDIANENCQMTVTIATTEYWESGGKERYYLSWWWY